MAKYYGDIVPGFATLAGPLNELRRSGVDWEWTPVRQAAFDHLKTALAENMLRAHFIDKEPVILTTDASPYCVGAVLLQNT